jgi:uncharacterized coiled-coil protein SlyX
MPDLSLSEAILGALAILGGGTAAGATIRRPRPGTPEDHELRLQKLEASDKDCDERVTRVETRMSNIETSIAGAIGQLNESVKRQWQAVEKLTESVDGLKECVIELDVEARIERGVREERRRRSKSDTDPTKKED